MVAGAEENRLCAMWSDDRTLTQVGAIKWRGIKNMGGTEWPGSRSLTKDAPLSAGDEGGIWVVERSSLWSKRGKECLRTKGPCKPKG